MDTKIDNYVIIASLKSEPTCKLMNRIPGLCLLISKLPDSALRADSSILEALPGKLDIKRHSPSILFFHNILSRENQIKLLPIFFYI